MIKNNNKLSQDELRQRVDGFSMKDSDEETKQDRYKIVDQPLYLTHSADLKDVKNK